MMIGAYVLESKFSNGKVVFSDLAENYPYQYKQRIDAIIKAGPIFQYSRNYIRMQ